uniref:Uncharacterized protein n=1 Tax=Anguilla anguilla TaxID=7936 RepID=A0A0E9XQP2_ANGAN
MKNNLFSTSGESSTEPFVRTHWNQNEEFSTFGPTAQMKLEHKIRMKLPHMAL